MAKATFEYTDESGAVHRTRNVADVPKAYLHSMIAYGDDPKADNSFQIQVPWDSTRLDIPQVLQDPRVLLVMLAALILLWRKSNNYLLRIILCSLAAVWLLFRGYDLIMGSKYVKMDEKPAPTTGARTDQNPG